MMWDGTHCINIYCFFLLVNNGVNGTNGGCSETSSIADPSSLPPLPGLPGLPGLAGVPGIPGLPVLSGLSLPNMMVPSLPMFGAMMDARPPPIGRMSPPARDR